MRYKLLLAALLASAIADASAQEQKTLLCTENYKYVEKNHPAHEEKVKCQTACNKYEGKDCAQKYLDEGWQVSRKKLKVFVEKGSDNKCVCIGTQYVLKKHKEPEMLSGNSASKEILLLKEEVEKLTKENERLKEELAQSKKK